MVRHPYPTQMATACFLWGLGDVITQKVVEKRPKIDDRRFTSLTAYGAVVAGPLYCWWYNWLEHATKSLAIPGAMGKFLMAKICADQFLFEPCNLAIYFMATKKMEGKSVQECVTETKEEIPTAFLTDTLLWPAIQYVNFKYIPLPFQAVYVNTFSLAWAVVLSYLSHKDHAPHHVEQTPLAHKFSASARLATKVEAVAVPSLSSK